jgi:hypothetical protein
MELNHKGKVVTFDGYDPYRYEGMGVFGINDPAFSKRILAEGDSWFSVGAIPSSNLLFPLRFAQSTLIVNLARPGDTIRKMSDISKNPELNRIVNQQNFATKWDAIFISGGGNDLLDQAKNIICRPSAGAGKHMIDYIDKIALMKFRTEIQAGFQRISNLRLNSKNSNTPIITHVYDYPTPRDAKSKFLGAKIAGPWLLPAFIQHGISTEYWISITDYLFEALASTLIDLETKIPNFHTISSTPNTLIRARLGTTGEDGDWLNEIHPTTKGYERLGAVVSSEIQHILNMTDPRLTTAESMDDVAFHALNGQGVNQAYPQAVPH